METPDGVATGDLHAFHPSMISVRAHAKALIKAAVRVSRVSIAFVEARFTADAWM
jgi:hypothetical protein